MKVSEFILDYLVKQGIDTIFGITGGFITPLFDAFHNRTDIKYICNQHEQSSAMAADGYARFRGLGVAVSTSGPGATNLITGIGCSYFDSIPVLCITGQVNTRDMRGRSRVRQRGFQETDIVSIVKPITKYAVQVTDPKEIQKELEAACFFARDGRPGPVLLDIPIDVLQAEIDPAKLDHSIHTMKHGIKPDISESVAKVVRLIAEAERPVVIYGQGATHAQKELLQFIEKTGIPCLPSWAALDMIPHDHPLYVDTFGVYGSRAGNFTVQNADLVIAVGTRLDGRMTGGKFAPDAHKVIVDVDVDEAGKILPALHIICDAGDFLRAMNEAQYSGIPFTLWHNRIAAWKDRYRYVVDSSNPIHPQTFIRALCDLLPDDSIIVPDCGANLSWTMQAFQIREGMRLFSAYGYSPMGYSLPAAIGASVATGKPVICIIGDGGMQVNIQELQTLAHYKIPVKIFILNNHGYGIIKQFQDELFEGRYEATGKGYSVPDFVEVGQAFQLNTALISGLDGMGWVIAQVLNRSGPVICDVKIDPDARIFPKVCYGDSLENMTPKVEE